jgi:hypothetical protein
MVCAAWDSGVATPTFVAASARIVSSGRHRIAFSRGIGLPRQSSLRLVADQIGFAA